MKLSIVICTSGRRIELGRCLASLSKQSWRNFEVVIVEKKNDLKGKTPQGQKREQERRLTERGITTTWVKDQGEGLSKARDLGWRAAKGKYVAWIDDDVVTDKDWAKNVVEILETDETVGGVSGPCVVPKSKLVKRRVFFWYHPKRWGEKILAYWWVKLVLGDRPFQVGRIYPWGWWSPGANFERSRKLPETEVDYLEACNMTMRRELVKEVGGFDWGYRGTSEWCEVDLARRVTKLGYRLVFHPKVRVSHEVSRAGEYTKRNNWRERANNWLRFRKSWLEGERMMKGKIEKGKVSIIVANNRSERLFEKTIKSLLVAREPWQELIVVNNGMRAETAKRITKKLQGQGVKVLYSQAGGAAGARNKGVRAAKGELLVFLDNDVEVEKGWLKKVRTYLQSHQRVGGGQLKLLRTDRRDIIDSAGEKLTVSGFLVERAREAKDRGQFDEDTPIFSGKGAGLVVRRNVFEKVGGFDEDYEYYWEEPDLFWRVWRAGYEVRFLWMGTVWHAYGTKNKRVKGNRVVKATYLGCRNQMVTLIKNGQGWQGWWRVLVVGLSWVGLGIIFGVSGKWQRGRAVGQAGWWMVSQGRKLRKKRRWVQTYLPSDEKWMKKVLVRREAGWYIGKCFAYVTGRRF